MAEQKSENDIEDICPEWLKELLPGLRSTNKYNDKLDELIFNLELPEDTSHAAAEALIILAADDFDNSLDRDAALAALGLVRGCSRLEQPKRLGPRRAVSWRRIQFLLKSSYIQDEDEYHQCERALRSIEGLEGHKVGGILTKLNKKDAEYIKNIASKIYQWYDCHVLEERLDFALKKYPPSNDGSYVDLENLPKLANPRKTVSNKSANIVSIEQSDIQQENLPHETDDTELSVSNTFKEDNTEIEQSGIMAKRDGTKTESDPTEVLENRENNKDIFNELPVVPPENGGTGDFSSLTEDEGMLDEAKNKKSRLIRAVLGIILTFAVGVIIGNICPLYKMFFDSTPQIDEILISPYNLNPTMRLREKKSISVRSEPDGSDINELEFEDHGTDVVKTSIQDGELTVIAYDEWREDDHEAEITLRGGLAAPVEIKIIVEPPYKPSRDQVIGNNNINKFFQEG